MNFDNNSLLLQTLMGRLQIRPQNNNTMKNPLLNQSLEDLLFDAASGLSDDNSDYDDDDDYEYGNSNKGSRSRLSKEERKLEKEIVNKILSGKIGSLKPNSGQAVTIGEHHICVGYHEEKGSDYRVWEWHGHIMLFDDENGYSPEYIYGNYFERLSCKGGLVGGVSKVEKEEEEEEEEEDEEEEEKEEVKVGNLGLRELIGGGDSGGARILHRNINASSQRLG